MTTTRFPTGPRGEKLAPVYEPERIEIRLRDPLEVNAAVPLDERRRRASEAVSAAMEPAPVRRIKSWLVQLGLRCAPQNLTAQDMALKAADLGGLIAPYPADVVRHVLLTETWRFFPSWDELRASLERHAAPRRMMLVALRDFSAEPERKPQISPERRRELIGESEAILAGMRDRAGMAPPRTETRRAARYGTDYWKRAADEARRGEQTGNQEKKP